MFSTAIINAGGKSSRMGVDKAFVKLNGRTLIDIVVDNVRKCFSDIILVTNEPSKYHGYRNISIIEDCVKGVGPIAGLYSGLKAAHSRYSFFIACDMPLINYHYIDYMKSQITAHGYEAVVTRRRKGIEPFHRFYSKVLDAEIDSKIKKGLYSFHSLLQNQNVLFVPEETASRFDEKLSFFANINTKEDIKSFHPFNSSG